LAAAAVTEGTPAPSSRVDRPQSRLSKRITRKPRRASVSQNPSGQDTIWEPMPMISNTGGSDSAPTVW
jgi:hypothetical protein